MPVNDNIDVLVKSLAKKPKFFKNVMNFLTSPNLEDARRTLVQTDFSDLSKVNALYSALKNDKIELVPEEIVPYLLRNGLLKSLSSIQSEQANAILGEVLQTSFVKEQNLSQQDISNLNNLVDNTINLVQSLKANPDTLETLGIVLAERIEFPNKMADQVKKGEITADEALKLENTANSIVISTLLNSAETKETREAILGLINQLAKTVDDHYQVALSETPEEIEIKEKRIAHIRKQLETNSADLKFHDECVEKKRKIEIEYRTAVDNLNISIDGLNESLKSKDIDQDDKNLLKSTIELSKKEILRLTKEYNKDTKEIDDKLKTNKLDSKTKINLEKEKAKLESEIKLNPLDQASLYVTKQLGLEPGELTKIAELTNSSIGSLLADPSLPQQIVGIQNLEANERLSELRKIAPKLLENQAESILHILENEDFKEIVKRNRIIKEQLASQGFTGQEDRVLTEVLDNLYPKVIKPALLDEDKRAHSRTDQKSHSVLHDLFDPTKPTEEKIHSTIDFLSVHRESASAILSSSMLTDPKLTEALVTRVTAEGETRKEALALVPEVSDIVSKNQELLKALANVALDNSETIKSLVSIYEKSKPKVEELAQSIQEVPAQAPVEVEYTQEGLEKLGIKGIPEGMSADDLQLMVEIKRQALAIQAQAMGQETTISPLHSIHEEGRKISSESYVSVGQVVEGNISLEQPQQNIVQPSKSLLSNLDEFIKVYKNSIPQILGSAAPVTQAILRKKDGVEELAKTYIEYSQAKDDKQKQEKFTSILTKGLEIAKDPQVVEATSQAIKDNRGLLVTIIDEKLDDLRKKENGLAGRILGRINGEFCLKAIEHANNTASITAIQKFIEKPKISSALYLAWKTNNIKVAIGAAAGYFKPENKVKKLNIENATSVSNPFNNSQVPRVLSRANSIGRVQ